MQMMFRIMSSFHVPFPSFAAVRLCFKTTVRRIRLVFGGIYVHVEYFPEKF